MKRTRIDTLFHLMSWKDLDTFQQSYIVEQIDVVANDGASYEIIVEARPIDQDKK